MLARQHHFDGPRGDEIDRVGGIAFVDDAFVGYGKSWSQQPLHPIELVSVKPGEQVKPGDQRTNVKAKIETRAMLGALRLVGAAA